MPEKEPTHGYRLQEHDAVEEELMAVTDREFGELKEKVRQMEATMMEIRHDVKEGNAVTDQILMKLSQVAGGWKVLIGVGAIAATVGGLVAKFLPVIFR